MLFLPPGSNGKLCYLYFIVNVILFNCIFFLYRYRETQETLKAMEEKTKAEIKDLERRLAESEERLKGLCCNMN